MARSSARYTNTGKQTHPMGTQATASSQSISAKPASGKAYVALAKEVKPEKIKGYTCAF